MSTELARTNGHGLVPQRELTPEQLSDASISTFERAIALRVPQAELVNQALASIDGRPLADRVLVLPLPKDDHFGSILIPDNAQEEHICGIVVSVGRGRYEHGTLVPMEVKPGNYVSFSKYSARKVQVATVELFQITEPDITFVASGKAAQ
jgi:chaperonin GroES